MTQNQTAAMIAAFQGWDSSNTSALTSAGRWHPPTGDYNLVLSKLDFVPDGLKYKDKTTGQEIVRPKLTLSWTILDGEFETKTFTEDDYIINGPNDPVKSDSAREMRQKAMDRLRGTLEVITGIQMPAGGGFPFLLGKVQELLNQGSSTPIKANVYSSEKDAEVPKDKANPNGPKMKVKRRYCSVTSLEPLDVTSAD